MTSNKQRREQAMTALEHEIKTRDRQEKTKPLGVVIASVVVILAVVSAIVFFATRNHSSTDTEADASSTPTSTATSAEPEMPKATVLDGKRATPLAATVSCDYKEGDMGPNPKKPGLPPATDIPATGTAKVTFVTNHGPIDLTLDRSASPCAVNSMIYLAQKGYYDNTVCHRITNRGIKVLQCGDPTGTGTGGPGFSFPDEYPVDEMNGKPVTYPRGSVAMANSGPSTNGSQFFLNYGDSPLRASYTYFGTIGAEGLKTLDAIASKGAQGGAPDGKPAEDVTITKVDVSK